MLSAKLALDQPPIAQQRPQLRFDARLILAALARAADGVRIVFQHTLAQGSHIILLLVKEKVARSAG
jgi:hypothetical protein